MAQVRRGAFLLAALVATMMALYLQLFERSARRHDAQLAAIRLDHALVESRARLRAEVVAELRAELLESGRSARPGTQPLPDTVLRRLETDGGAGGAPGQALGAFHPQEALALVGLQEALGDLEREMEESDRAVRRDLEELRTASLYESDVSSKTSILMLIALISLIGHLLLLRWPRSAGAQEEKEESGATPP